MIQEFRRGLKLLLCIRELKVNRKIESDRWFVFPDFRFEIRAKEFVYNTNNVDLNFILN